MRMPECTTSTERQPRAALGFTAEGPIEFAAAKEGEERAKFSMLANSGKPMQHWWWGMFAVDLQGIEVSKPKKPVLLQHDPEQRLGWTESFRIEDDGLHIDGFLLKSKAAQEIVDDAKDGFPFEASISVEGVSMERVVRGETITVNGYEMQGPGMVMRKSHFREVSFVALGADQNTAAAVLAKDEEGDTELITVTQKKKDVEMSEETVTVTVESVEKDHPEIASALTAKGRKAAIDGAKKIIEMAGEGRLALALELIDQGISPEAAKAILEAAPAGRAEERDERLEVLRQNSPDSSEPSDGTPVDLSTLPLDQQWARMSEEQRSEFFDDFGQFKFAKSEEAEAQ